MDMWVYLYFHWGEGGVNHGNNDYSGSRALEGKNKNHFLSSMYLGVLINCAADYLFYVTLRPSVQEMT